MIQPNCKISWKFLPNLTMQSKFYCFKMFSEDEILTKIHEMFAEEPFILLQLNKILPKCNRLVNLIFIFL